jgi:hypothetical protein
LYFEVHNTDHHIHHCLQTELYTFHIVWLTSCCHYLLGLANGGSSIHINWLAAKRLRLVWSKEMVKVSAEDEKIKSSIQWVHQIRKRYGNHPDAAPALLQTVPPMQMEAR